MVGYAGVTRTNISKMEWTRVVTTESLKTLGVVMPIWMSQRS